VVKKPCRITEVIVEGGGAVAAATAAAKDGVAL
jgi:hypothetical protein